jgi:glycyl-tRNA synthetase
MSVTMEQIVQLAKTRGFIYPGSEIYDGLANSWDYGPLGAQMRMNIKNDWWKRAVEQRQDMVGLDGAILMNPRVWEASGHTESFTDPLVEDKVTHKRYRADHLIEAVVKDVNPDGMTVDQLNDLIKEHDIKSPDGNALTKVKTFNLMFETGIGKTEGDKMSVYLRPETAQAMFVNFKNILTTSRKRLPFGVAQIGKAFRNEITPGNFTYRTLEFEQMEIEFFCEEEEWQEHFTAWHKWMQEWAENIGIDTSKLHDAEIEEEKLAHYSKRTVDFEFEFPFGTKELWGLAYRTDFDLRNHMEQSGERLEYTDPNDNKRKIVPHVIEPTMGVDRTMLAILLSAYEEEEVEGDTRIVLRLKPHIAPYQIAVLPLSKKEELQGVSHEVTNKLGVSFRIDYDETQSIGKRYRRQDEIGTPYCVTVDFDSLEDQAVTVRDRDTMKQERIKIDELEAYFREKLSGIRD